MWISQFLLRLRYLFRKKEVIEVRGVDWEVPPYRFQIDWFEGDGDGKILLPRSFLTDPGCPFCRDLKPRVDRASAAPSQDGV